MTHFDAEYSAGLTGPSWLRAERVGAARRFESRALPTDALEEWRYSQIDALDLGRYMPVPGPGQPAGAEGPTGPGGAADPAGPAGAGTGGRSVLEALLGSLPDGSLLVETDDGVLTSTPAGASRAGVTVRSLSDPSAEPVELGAIAGEPDAFVTLNRAAAPGPLRVTVAPGADPPPVVVVHRVGGLVPTGGGGAAVFPRLLVEVGPNARARVVEIVVGGGASLVVPVTELDIRDGSNLGYAHLQLLGPEAWQIGLQASRVARDASLVSAAVAVGGEHARLRTDSALTGPGAESRLLALYFAAGRQLHDFRTVQHHRAPHTTSDLLYKGAVANSSRSVYSGLIHVDKGARGTNAQQTNRNLVLHEGAHADSVPNLEIEDNDVRCSHASAVGPIAEDQRFYLESRGVPSGVADRLIALGFMDEVLDRLPLPSLAPVLRAALAAKLVEAEATEAALAPQGASA